MDGRECDKLVGLGDERGDNLLLFVSSPKVSVHSANDSDHSAAREKKRESETVSTCKFCVCLCRYVPHGDNVGRIDFAANVVLS